MPRKDNTRLAILLGVPFHDVTMGETLDRIDALIAARTPGYLATANLDFAAQASQDVELQRILFDAELVLCDGTPLVWASRWLGAPLRERVAGSDMMPHLFARAAERGHRLFFLGLLRRSAGGSGPQMPGAIPGPEHLRHVRAALCPAARDR